MVLGKVKHFLKDGTGFVERLEVFGTDLTVVNAARVSLNTESKEMAERDIKLLNYLARHHHISPFFHPQVRFRIMMPIFVAREWFRHTVGLSRNEVSRRYVDAVPRCWIPPRPEDIRERDSSIKQGSKKTPVAFAEGAFVLMAESVSNSMKTYAALLERGVAPEIARAVLPQSMFTEFIETGSLYAYFRICSLRLDPTAQKEIREYAEKINQCLSHAFPHSWKALRMSSNK